MNVQAAIKIREEPCLTAINPEDASENPTPVIMLVSQIDFRYSYPNAANMLAATRIGTPAISPILICPGFCKTDTIRGVTVRLDATANSII